MKNQISIVLLLVVFLFGCASVQKGNHAERTGEKKMAQKLSISYDINRHLSTENFGMLEFMFSNPKNQWVEIKSIELVIDDTELGESVKLTSGLEFDNWHKAMRKIRAVENYNQSVVMSSLMLASAVAASSSSSGSGRSAGLAGLGFMAGSYTLSEFSKAKTDVESTELFPAGHLLRNPDKVPPGLFLEKWLLVDTSNVSSNKILKSIELRIAYGDHSEDRYYVDLENLNGNSTWQRIKKNSISVSERKQKKQETSGKSIRSKK